MQPTVLFLAVKSLSNVLRTQFKISTYSQVQLHTLVIPAVRKFKQEDHCETETSQGYLVRPYLKQMNEQRPKKNVYISNSLHYVIHNGLD